MIGLGLYRFDINFRESAVGGIVGGGGIGATLNTAFDRYEFDSAAAILLIIIALVMLMEYSSGYLGRWGQRWRSSFGTARRCGICASAARSSRRGRRGSRVPRSSSTVGN